MTNALKVVTFVTVAFAPLAAMAVTPAPNIALGPDSVAILIGILRDWVFTIILALASLVVLIGAFNILTAGGDAAKVTAGRNWIVWGIVGLVIAILARGLLTLACTFVGYSC